MQHGDYRAAVNMLGMLLGVQLEAATGGTTGVEVLPVKRPEILASDE